MFCANKEKFSFRWIEEQFVQVHPEKMSVKMVISHLLRDREEFVGVICIL